MEIALRSFGRIDIVGSCQELFKLFVLINDTPLIDRLYRRYVKREDGLITLNQLKEKHNIFGGGLLGELIIKFAGSIEKSENSLIKFGEYVPVHLVICDMPYPLIEEDIPLEDYDNLEGDPLWMRPEYMLEKYG